MKRASLLITLAVGLSACDGGNPAGGRGYFDPPPPARFTASPMSPTAPVPVDGQATALDQTQTPAGAGQAAPASSQTVATAGSGTAGTPRSAIDANDPNTELADEVSAALGFDIGIDPNDDSINLALDSQEVQERERAAAQARREAAQEQLVVIEPEPVPQADINANVVKFARETTHPVGTRRYNRPAFRDRIQSASVCRRFETPEEAQRRFLANGGPESDRFNLDPDGDGFACRFDPEKYRKLNF